MSWDLKFVYGYMAWLVTQSCHILSAVHSVIISWSCVYFFPLTYKAQVTDLKEVEKSLAGKRTLQMSRSLRSFFFFLSCICLLEMQRKGERVSEEAKLMCLTLLGNLFIPDHWVRRAGRVVLFKPWNGRASKPILPTAPCTKMAWKGFWFHHTEVIYK